MKSKIIISLAVMLVGLVACKKDVIDPGPDPNAPPQFVSFKSDLVPLFSKSCALSGCHDGVSHNPALTSDKAYSSITSGGYISLQAPSSSVLYGEVK